MGEGGHVNKKIDLEHSVKIAINKYQVIDTISSMLDVQ
jgi:hypothetical protein